MKDLVNSVSMGIGKLRKELLFPSWSMKCDEDQEKHWEEVTLELDFKG